MNARNALLSLVLTIAASAPAHAGTVVASPPLAVDDGDSYDCSVVNAGTKDLGGVVVSVSKMGLTLGTGIIQTCSTLAPIGECSAATTAGSGGDRNCSVVVDDGSAKVLRGRFCNLTTGECVDLR